MYDDHYDDVTYIVLLSVVIVYMRQYMSEI